MGPHPSFAAILPILCAAIGSAADPLFPDTDPPPTRPGMTLFWNDEFAVDGRPDPRFWSSESGFARNEELQWYQSQNATCKGGVLLIEGRKERVRNPNYSSGSSSWKTNRQYAEYTSTSLTTSGRKTWLFGRVEVRARLDGQMGSWPAIWTLGTRGEWPSNGEVDIMEFYPSGTTPLFHANLAWGTATRWQAAWNSKTKTLSSFTSKDPDWLKKFHVWTMDWTKDSIILSLDNTVMNAASLANTRNNDGTNPFKDRSQYILLNLAIGANGGDPSKATFPMKYEVDYVRVYQPGASSISERLAAKNWKAVPVSGAPGQFLLTQSVDPDARWEIRDATGRPIVDRLAGNEIRLDLTREPVGVYIVRLRTRAGDAVATLVR